MFGGAAPSQSKASDDLLQLGNPFADMFSAPAPAPQANNNMWMNNGKKPNAPIEIYVHPGGIYWSSFIHRSMELLRI